MSTNQPSHLLRRAAQLLCTAILILATSAVPAASARARDLSTGDTKTACVYASDHVSLLDQFSTMIGLTINCAMVFNDAAPTWAGWEQPWFLSGYADMNWGAWATARGTHRQLVITQNLFPSSENSAAWLTAGAAGEYRAHAVRLARNLVAAGLGHSIIRLAHEANGTWYPDSIPATPRGDAEWVRFWDNTVIAMRSVRGAHFRFDWCVNPGVRAIPLRDFYPGNRFVNIIGVDAYDAADPSQTGRWARLYNEPDGVGQVLRFAQAHHKALSFPEWGLTPSIDPQDDGGSDDPDYVRSIARIVQHDDVAYQSYFFSAEMMMQLQHSPRSLRAYRRGFGFRGVAGPTAMASSTLSTLTFSAAPSLVLTSGPRYQSVLPARNATFHFVAQRGFTPVCSLDGQPWRACSSNVSDTLRNLGPGYHWWAVQVMTGATESVKLIQSDFMVR